jgi:hypothetical protein
LEFEIGKCSDIVDGSDDCGKYDDSDGAPQEETLFEEILHEMQVIIGM